MDRRVKRVSPLLPLLKKEVKPIDRGVKGKTGGSGGSFTQYHPINLTRRREYMYRIGQPLLAQSTSVCWTGVHPEQIFSPLGLQGLLPSARSWVGGKINILNLQG